MIHIYVHATVRLIPTINHIVNITNHSIGSITIGGRYYEDIFHFIRQRTLIAKGLMVDWFTSLGLSALEEALLSPTLSLSWTRRPFSQFGLHPTFPPNSAISPPRQLASAIVSPSTGSRGENVKRRLTIFGRQIFLLQCFCALLYLQKSFTFLCFPCCP